MSSIASAISGQTGTQLPAASGTSSTAATNPYNLQASDFIKMMITQLQNQDPTQPMTNQDLLSQINQIGQMQTSTQLQQTMQSVQMQTQIGAASSLLGKAVQGLDANNNPVSGIVNSVQVAGSNVTLALDSGASLALSSVTSVAPPTAATN